MPEVTRDELVSGFNGLTVVFARRKAATPNMAVATPASAIAIAAIRRKRAGTSTNGVANETPHIAAAASSATTGGGILSSSVRISLRMGSDGSSLLVTRVRKRSAASR